MGLNNNAILFQNFRIVDEISDFSGSLIIEDGFIKRIMPHNDTVHNFNGITIEGKNSLVLMPAFIDLHAHFRDTGSGDTDTLTPDETVEAACLAAAAGGFGTVMCMANTKPVTDTAEKALILKNRADALGLIDLYPVVSLTKNMEGRELTSIPELPPGAPGAETMLHGSPDANAVYRPLLLSEDGKDISDNAVFLAAMKQAARLKIPVSCHCDYGGTEAEELKAAGRPRSQWSRIGENNAVRRAIELGKAAGCHVHIAHVSTAEAAALIRNEKKSAGAADHPGFKLTGEATPHHIGANEEDAVRMGSESYGRVNPPLRTEADRTAIIKALCDGSIDAISTDHAPHSNTGKAAGAPGFSGLETAFSVCLTNLSQTCGLQRLSALMSSNPAQIAGLDTGIRARGRITPGLAADLVIADIHAQWKVEPDKFKSRGKCSPFAGKTLQGKIIMTIHNGRIVFQGDSYA